VNRMNNESRAKILITDDVEMNRMILAGILEETYDIIEAGNGQQTLDILASERVKPDLILLDIVMPVMDGLETLEHIKGTPALRDIPVIFITAETENEAKGLSGGAVDYILKPFEPDIVCMRVATQIELSRHRHHLEQMVAEKTAEVVATKEIFMEIMADLIECRSAESGQHVKRTKDLSALLLMLLVEDSPYMEQLRGQDCSAIVKAVPLHDVGKISIPDHILLKPGKLTDEEFEIIKTHTTEGAGIIDTLIASGIDDEYTHHCHDICRHHHERWDGTGYPMGLKGQEIPLSARVVALVDVYDALVSERCYKKAMSHEDAVKIIEESSGTHFDPAVVDVFLPIHEAFRKYA